MTMLTPPKAIALLGLFCVLPSGHAEEEIKIKSVELKVKTGMTWISTPGRLFKLIDGSRKYLADIDKAGLPDVEVKCKAGDRFEADAVSPLDRPSPPPRIVCGDTLTFKYVRAVYASFSGSVLASSAIEPRLYSELALRSAKAGARDASIAFNDAAVASTAQLLGDTNLDQYVVRDPLQDFKLVLSPAGINALKTRQKNGGIKDTGAIDLATQNEFTAPLFANRNDASLLTPAITCGKTSGMLTCSTAAEDFQSPPSMTAPAFKIENQKLQ